MAQYYHNSAVLDPKNQRTGMTWAVVLHSLLLLLIFWKIFGPLDPPPPPAPEFYVDLEIQPTAPIEEKEVELDADGGVPGPENETEKEGGSQGSPAPGPPENKIEEDNTQKADRIEDARPIESKPTQAPVLTAPDPSSVKLPDIPKPRKIENPAPATDPQSKVDDESKVKIPQNAPDGPKGGAGGKTGSGSTGDDDAPGTGGSGTGTGTGSGDGKADSGTGTGGGGGIGSNPGEDGRFQAIGTLKRQPIYRPPNVQSIIAKYPKEVGGVTFNICINQDGLVTYLRPNTKLTATRNTAFIKDALKLLKDYKFKPDGTAPLKECGLYKFKVSTNM